VAFLNLMLAGFWLIVALVLLLPLWLAPEQPVLVIPGTKLPIGWLALVMGAYNVIRWWMIRSQRQQQREMQDGLARLRKRRILPREPVEPDPNFNFTEEPPKSPGT
jgi:hypothetical protein